MCACFDDYLEIEHVSYQLRSLVELRNRQEVEEGNGNLPPPLLFGTVLALHHLHLYPLLPVHHDLFLGENTALRPCHRSMAS